MSDFDLYRLRPPEDRDRDFHMIAVDRLDHAAERGEGAIRNPYLFPHLERRNWGIAHGHFSVSENVNCSMLTTKQELNTVAETTVSIVDALRGQQDQLKRLIAQKMWISDAPKATLSEIRAQMTELKRLLDQLDADIQEQLKEGQ
jgi:hypothetical protein